MGSTLALLWKRELLPDDRDNPARLGWGVPLPDFAPAFEERFGCTLIDCYGSTDVGLPVCGVPAKPKPPGACGKAVEGCEVAILSPEGRRLRPGHSGEIAVRVDEPPDVVEAAAIGVPSELTEEDIKVAAIARPGAGLGAPALARWLAERLPRYMTVRYVELVDDLPRTDTQKVMKTALRVRWRTPGTWDAEQARYLPEEGP